MNSSRWWSRGALLLICAVTVARVALTHDVFSPTYDEPLHVASGFEYVAEHHYRVGMENPPLARAFFAWPLRHAHPTSTDGIERIGEVYESAGDFMRGVVLSRRGNLVFVVIGIVSTALLAGELGVNGVLAALIFAMLPVILAHGGLATPDVAGTSAVALALYVFVRWLDRQSWGRTLALGAGIAFVFLTKFTFAFWFVIGALALMAVRRRMPVRSAMAASVFALAIIYSFYLYAHDAPKFLLGIVRVLQLSGGGQDAYLLGDVRHMGFWYYFPLVLAVKTPIPVLLLALFGMRKREFLPLTIMAAGILAVSMLSKADLGVRHIMPIFVPLSILAAGAVRNRWAIPFYAWLIAGSFLAHPDYLPWMNAFAGKHPERVVVDSNFDWGQDVVRLRDACRAKGIRDIGIAIFGTVDMKRIGMPPVHDIDPASGAPGWYAVSESFIIPAQARDPRAYTWLTREPFERIGKTIRLYHIRG